MGKKKVAEDTNVTTISRPKVFDDFEDDFFDAASIMDEDKKIISVSPSFDLSVGGIPEGCFVALTGKEKIGKASSINSLIHTPFGPKKMKNIHVNDLVCTPSGGVSRVDGVYPQGKMEIYKVTFDDGSYTECTKDHIWKVQKTGRKEYELKTLNEILLDGPLIAHDKAKRVKWYIPITKPVIYNEKPVLMHPYLLGCILGDGGITTNSIIFTTADQEMVDRLNSLLPHPYSFKHGGRYCYKLNSNKNINKYRLYLEKYGLMGLSSHYKFIPKDYLYNSIENRLELLRGLLDTDGSVIKDKNNPHKGTGIEYSTTSIRLARGVRQLALSLGGKVTIAKKRFTKNNTSEKRFYSYRLIIAFNDPSIAFWLPRKKNICVQRNKPDLKRSIIDIQLSRIDEAQCIHLDDDNHLYLVDDYIVTHNTTLALWIAAQAQKQEYANAKLCPEGRFVFYSQIEHRLKKRDMSGIQGLNLDPSRFKLIQSSPGKILSSEDHCIRIERVVNEVPGCVVIIDSFSMLSSQAEQAADIGYQDRGKSNTIISQLMRKIAAPLAINKCIVIGITHGMANTSGWGASFIEKSANALKYAEDIKLVGKGVIPWRIGTDEKTPQIGQKCDWFVQFAAINAPGGHVNTHFRYGMGIDIYSELVEIAEELGLIDKGPDKTEKKPKNDVETDEKNTKKEAKKGGSWYRLAYLNDDSMPKLNGIEQIINYLRDNPEHYKELKKQVYEMVGCDYLLEK